MRTKGAITTTNRMHTSNFLKSQLALLKALMRRNESNVKRAQNEIALVCSIWRCHWRNANNTFGHSTLVHNEKVEFKSAWQKRP
jgi:hypothetical protein